MSTVEITDSAFDLGQDVVNAGLYFFWAFLAALGSLVFIIILLIVISFALDKIGLGGFATNFILGKKINFK